MSDGDQVGLNGPRAAPAQQAGLGWPRRVVGSVDREVDTRLAGAIDERDHPQAADKPVSDLSPGTQPARAEDATDDTSDRPAQFQAMPDASEAGPDARARSADAVSMTEALGTNLRGIAHAAPGGEHFSASGIEASESRPVPRTIGAEVTDTVSRPPEDPRAWSIDTDASGIDEHAAQMQALPDASEADSTARHQSAAAADVAVDALGGEPISAEGTSPVGAGPDQMLNDDEFVDLPPGGETPVPRMARDRRSWVPLPPPPDTRVIVIANQKGGVGKTTTAVNLATALAMGGLRVLVLDLDPQGNASTALGIEHTPGTTGTYEVLTDGESIADHVRPSPESEGLSVLPATVDLAAAEIELVSMVARESRLARALRSYLRDHKVDYVFLDCPPSLGLLTLNALVAAREILIPIQCEYYALEGVSQLINTIDLVKGELNDDLQLSTVLLTMFDARTRLAAQVTDEVRTHFPEQTLHTVIPRSVRISEAPSYGQTVLTYHPDSVGAVCYLRAAEEIAHRGASQEDVA